MSLPGEKAGRDDIFREVLGLHGYIRRFAAVCGVPFDLLEDFAQDVLLLAWTAVTEDRFAPPDSSRSLRESVRAWLSGIIRHKAHDVRRLVKLRVRTLVAPSHDMCMIAVAGGADDSVLIEDALKVLARLRVSALTRKVIALGALGMTAREIAEELGIPIDTAATCLRRARIAYRKALRRG